MSECTVKYRYFQHFLAYLVTYIYIYIFIMHLFTHFIYLFCENKKNRIRRNGYPKNNSKRMGARGGAVS